MPSFGLTCVWQFVENTRILGDRTVEQWQHDTLGQVEAWLRAMKRRD